MTADEILQLIGMTFVTTFQTEMDTILNPLRKHIAKGRPLSLGKELWEYAVADSIAGAEWCGAGHSIIDVKIGNDIGCDVKSISHHIDGKMTAEASMYQTFHGGTAELFKNKDTLGLWNLFIDGWHKKVKSMKEYYMLIIVRDHKLSCSLFCFKYNNNSPAYLDTNCSFLTETGRVSDCNLKINSIADPSLLDIRIYKSKTRLEMRLKQKMFTDQSFCLPIYKFQ